MAKQWMQLEIKGLSAEGSFEGILSPYNNLDQMGDVVEPGAYTKTLQEHGNTVPMLWQHKTDCPIGELTLEDKPDGLWCKGQLLLAIPEAQKAYLLIKSGIIKGLSIGYESVKDTVLNGVRHLKEVRLWEGSVVTFGANMQALITSVKAIEEIKDDFTAELAPELMDAFSQMRSALDATKETISQKAGRAISAATRDQLMMAHDHARACADAIQALLGSEAGKTTSKPEAAMKSEPAFDHSALMGRVDSMRALIPRA